MFHVEEGKSVGLQSGKLKGRGEGRKGNFVSVHSMLDIILGGFHSCGGPSELAFSVAGELSLGGSSSVKTLDVEKWVHFEVGFKGLGPLLVSKCRPSTQPLFLENVVMSPKRQSVFCLAMEILLVCALEEVENVFP